MKVLLLHPEDGIPQAKGGTTFDLIVDLARAPKATYELWSRESRCRVISVYDFVDSVEDLAQVRKILNLQQRELIDEHGIDWWDLVSYLVLDGLLASLLLARLAREIGRGADLFCTRPDTRAEVLQTVLGSTLRYLTPARHTVGKRLRRYRNVMSRLDRAQIAQVVEDKWDPLHQIRRQFGRRRPSQGEPIVLLPSAYINVSRTAVAYAKLLPSQKFLLVYARRSGKLTEIPANVHAVPLHPYYPSKAPNDLADILARWKDLRMQMICASEEMRQADLLGGMNEIPSYIARGVAARDAWNCVFEGHNVAGCLSADDVNVYTRIPLILAQRRGLASVACHHGALDYRMAVKTRHGNAFLAKSEMERDYLENVCGLVPEKIIVGGPAASHLESDGPVSAIDRSWLMFFTEPYEADAWRVEEVYRDLLPRLLDLARSCGLRLVLKLHPFESIKEHKNLHARLLSSKQRRELDILAGPLPTEFWNKINFAITVQSSVALECTQRRIPVFLCGWLQARYGGYLRQFAKFGAGEIIRSPEELTGIPARLASYAVSAEKLGTQIQPAALATLLLHSATRPADRSRVELGG
jgi:hypothetical protein